MARFATLLTVLLVAFLIGGWSIGDDKKTTDDKKDPPAKLRGMLPANWGKLGLTDEQKQKVYKVQKDYGEKIDKLEAEIKKIDDEMKAERYKILTDAQKARLKEILSKEPGGDKKE